MHTNTRRILVAIRFLSLSISRFPTRLIPSPHSHVVSVFLSPSAAVNLFACFSLGMPLHQAPCA